MTITREQVEAYAKAIESCDWTYLFKSSGSKSFRDEAASLLRDLWQRVEQSEKRANHLLAALRRDGYWSAVMTDEEVWEQIDAERGAK